MRQLTLHLKGAYGVYLVTEEVNAERQFATERIHIKYTATHGKLSWLIHIVGLTKAKLT